MNKNILVIFLVWLALLLAVGFWSRSFPVYPAGKCTVKNQLPYYRWDSFWYASIANHGYDFSVEKNSSIAFFPLYPMLLKTTHVFIPIRDDRISFVLNILFSFLAASFLYRLARLDFPEKTSLIIVATFLFFPPAYFFLSGYPDILFALLAILSLYFSRRQNWGKAGIAAGLLAISKPYGILLFPIIIIEYLWSNRWDMRVFWKKSDWLALLLPLFTLGGFILFNYLKFHTPFAFFETQQTWGRSLADPPLALLKEAKHFLLDGKILTGTHSPYLFYFTSFIFSIVAFVLSWKRVRKSYLIFPVLILLSAFLTGTLTSWGRYMLLGFPILIGPAVYLSEKKWLCFAYLALSTIIMIFTAHFFVRCYPFE